MNFISRIKPGYIIQLAGYALLAYISYALITNILQISVFNAMDSRIYIGLADNIRLKGILAAADDIRTYGYPLFVSLCEQLFLLFSPQGNPVLFVPNVQVLFLAFSAALAVSMLDRLSPRKFPLWLKFILFFVIQFMPMLLGLTRDVLGDSLTVFWVTLFLWALISEFGLKYLVASVAIACAIVTRPFNEPWAIALIAILLIVAFVRRAIAPVSQTPRPDESGRQAGPVKTVSLISILAQIVLPLVIIVGFQFYLVYLYTGTPGLIGAHGARVGEGLFWQGTYAYKYETYMGKTPDHSPSVFYTSTARAKLANQPDLVGDMVRVSLADPLGTLYITGIKIVGMFQQYEWSTYRVTLNNEPNVIFWSGMFLFTCFVYVNMEALRLSRFFNTGAAGQKLTVSHAGTEEVTLNLSLNLSFLLRLKSLLMSGDPLPKTSILWLAVNLYVVLYSIFSVPEPRYIAPVIPTLVIYAIYTFISSKRRSTLISAILMAGMLYLITYGILLSSLT